MHLTLRMNDEEQKTHKWLMEYFGFDKVHGSHAATIKQAEIVAYNVLQGLFGSKFADLFKRGALESLAARRHQEGLR